jgi:GT2 family glycosyltransferase
MSRERFEVVVADNASRDRTADVAREGGATVVDVPVPGRARGRNRAVAASSAPLLAFTDADCLAIPGWLESLTGCLEVSPLAAGPVHVDAGSPPNLIERLELLWRFTEQERHVKDEGWSVTANLGMHRSAFDAVGGFDESFRHIGEDLDLCWRARDAGYGLAWCEGAVVSHPAERTLRPVLRRAAAQAHSEHQINLLYGKPGGRHWRHPGPLVRGDFALRHLGGDPESMDPGMRRRLLRLARLDYAARMAGSAWAGLTLGRRARSGRSAPPGGSRP